MYRGARVAVVVPAYNEAPHIGGVIEGLPAIVDRVYVIDDGSTDGTWEAIEDAIDCGDASDPDNVVIEDGGTGTLGDDRGRAGEDQHTPTHRVDRGRSRPGSERLVGTNPDPPESRVVAVRLGENRGVGGAISIGYRLALSDGADVVATMGGDGQMDPTQLERVLDPVVSNRADYAKGNRLAGRGYWRGMSAWRLFGNVLLTGLTRIASGYWGLRDPQNGYTAISRGALEEIDLDGLYPDYGFLNDLLVALNLADARVADVPLPAIYGDEESGIRYRTFIPSLSALLLVNFLRRLLVEGTRKGRVWIPVTYGFAGTAWLGTVVSVLGVAIGPTGAVGTPLGLVVLSVAATLLAVALDRRANTVLVPRETSAVSSG